MEEYLLNAERICKSFPAVRALDGVNFNLKAGEVHALLGENGAGKSTLMKIFAGVYAKDSGNIFIRGKKLNIDSPRSARQLGIGIIHQELNLCPHLSVAENIFLGKEKSTAGIISKRQQHQDAQILLKKLNIDLDTNTLIKDLPVSKRQMVEICKTMSENADIIIMDEPTSALSDREIDDLFILIHELKKQQKGIIYISHRLEELSRITDRVTILRDGSFIATHNFADISLDDIIREMVGRQLNEKFPRISVPLGAKILEVKNLSAGKLVKDISFDLNQGEIVGIAGLVGAGRTETLRAIFGADKAFSKTLILKGRPLTIRSPRDAIKQGVFLVPEDRKQDGLCIKLTVVDNLTMPNLDLVSKVNVVSKKKQKIKSLDMIKRLLIKTPNIVQYAKNLSGGNQQKIVVGKWLMRKANLLMFDEPTKGIDVAAKIQIYNIMNDLKQNGTGVVFVSSELSEILGMADRILVMCNGKITANLEAAKTSQEEILHFATAF